MTAKTERSSGKAEHPEIPPNCDWFGWKAGVWLRPDATAWEKRVAACVAFCAWRIEAERIWNERKCNLSPFGSTIILESDLEKYKHAMRMGTAWAHWGGIAEVI